MSSYTCMRSMHTFSCERKVDELRSVRSPGSRELNTARTPCSTQARTCRRSTLSDPGRANRRSISLSQTALQPATRGCASMGKPEPTLLVGAGNLETARREVRIVGGGASAPKWNGDFVVGVKPATGHARVRGPAC